MKREKPAAAPSRKDPTTAQLNSLEQRVGALENSVQGLTNAVDDLEDEVSDLDGRLDNLEDQFNFSGANITIEAPGTLTLKGSSVTVQASAILNLKGSTTKINNGSTPVALQGGVVTSASPTGPLVGTITNGSTTIFAK